MLAQRVYDFHVAVRFIVSRGKHAHGGKERDRPFALTVESSQDKHGLTCDVSTGDAGTGMPDFCASESATASQTTVLISSSLRGNFAIASSRK